MRARADEEEILHVFADVVRTEPGALGEDRLELEGGAEMGVELRLEIERRPDELADDVLAQIGAELFQRGENGVGVEVLHRVPVDVAAEIRHGREDIEAFAAGRRERGIGARRRVEIEREIVGEDFLLEDVLEQFLVALGEDDGVVRQLGVGAVGAEIDEEEAHRVAHPFEPRIGPFFARRGRHGFLVEIGHVGVGDDDDARRVPRRSRAGRRARCRLRPAIASTRVLSRSLPPISVKRRSSPCTSAPVPPMAKWTPHLRSR